MAGGCNGSHWAGDLHTCHDIPQLRELNDEQALTLLPVTIYLGLLMVLGICGNLLVWYVYYFRFKKTPSNYFVLCLATLDLLTCIFAAPFEIYDVAKPLMFDMPIACKTMRFLETVTTVASGITLVAVAWDRYRKVFKPFQRISNKRAKILTYIAVAIGVFFAWPTFFINGSKHVRTKEPNITGISCSTSDSVRSTVYPKLYSAFLLLLFFVSVGFLIVFYSKVGLEIRKRGNMRLSQTPTAFQYNDTSLSMEPGDEESSSGGQRPSSARDTRKKYNIPVPTSPSTPKTASKFSNLKSPTNPKSPTDLNQSIAARAGYNPGKTTLILFCVSVAFVLSFLPYVIVKIIQAANSGFDMFPNDSSFVAYNFATRSFLINAAVNPIIYSCLNDAFRKECKALAQKCFTRCKRCQSCRRDL